MLEPEGAAFKEIIVVPDYPEREADEKMLAEVVAAPEEPDPPADPYPNGMY